MKTLEDESLLNSILNNMRHVNMMSEGFSLHFEGNVSQNSLNNGLESENSENNSLKNILVTNMPIS